MSTKLNCDIVRDLLPSYVDGLTSKTTNEAVNEHLKECPECTEALKRMKEPEKTNSEPKAEVNYLKKIRRRSLQKGFIVCAIIVILALAAASFKILYIGEEARTEGLYSDILVTDSTVKIEGVFDRTGSGLARVVFSENDGVVDITVYSAPKCFVNKEHFSKEYEAKGDVKEVHVNGLTLWENGRKIEENAARLYSLKTPYMGQIINDLKIAEALNIAGQLGGFANELHTAQEPYGWSLIFDDEFTPYRENEIHSVMLRNSCVLMALIENLDYVTWEYRAEGEQKEYTVTAQEASNFAGRDIKSFSSSATEVQNLLDKLNMNKYGKMTLFTEEVFFMEFENNSDTNIKNATIDYYLDGELVGTQGTQNADNSDISKGDFFEFRFVPDDFPLTTQNYEMAKFSFDLRFTDEYGKEHIVCENKKFPVQYGLSYRFSLTGDSEAGFTLTEK